MKIWLSKISLAAVLALLVVSVTSPVLAAPPRQGGGFAHIVDFGEDLYRIADHYGVTVESLLWHNGLNGPTEIYVGMRLHIPLDKGGRSDCNRHHMVRFGETLSGIALYYETTVWLLKEHNNELAYEPIVHTGQYICIPTEAGTMPHYKHDDYPTQHMSGRDDYGSMPGYHDDKQSYHASEDMNNDNGYQVPPLEQYPPKGAKESSYDDIPESVPTYQIGPILPILPAADQPVEVVINGRMSWMSEVSAGVADPGGVTTLIVSVSGKISPTIRIQSGDFIKDGLVERSSEFGSKPRAIFRNVPPGEYDVWLVEAKESSAEEMAAAILLSHKVRVKAETGKQVEVTFQMGHIGGEPILVGTDGWYLVDWFNPSKSGENLGKWSNIRIHAPSANLPVLIESDGGGYQSRCVTGTKDGGGCDLPALGAGTYIIRIEGSDYAVKTYMDGNAFATLSFAQQKVGPDKGQHGETMVSEDGDESIDNPTGSTPGD